MIIAEIGQAHEGSLGIAHSYIDALCDCGIRAIKFQTHIAEAESSSFETFRTKFSYEDKTRYDYWKRMEFSVEEWIGLKKHCDDKKIEFISSPFSLAAVDLLEKIGVKKYKIGSGETTNFLMLDRIRKINKPIILSSGMSDYDEIKNTLKFLLEYNSNISLLQCTTSYPTKPENWGLLEIPKMISEFGIPIGFSDHSGDIYSSLAATSLGASIIEFHAVFDKKMFGPDSKSSLDMKQIKNLVEGVTQIKTSLVSPYNKKISKSKETLKILFGKSLCVNKDLKKGSIIKFQDLESKKPGNQGISCQNYEQVIGKKTNLNLKKWSFLKQSDLE
jgi:N,N'-diacetyllegionaminate synthase